MTFLEHLFTLSPMAKVNIDVPSILNAQDTFTKIKSFFDDDSSDLKKYDPRLACTFNDSQMSGVAKGDKFNAELKVNTTGDKSSVSIILELPLLLTPFKGQIKSTVEKKLNALLS